MATPLEIAFSVSDSAIDNASMEKCKEIQSVYKAVQECRKTAMNNDTSRKLMNDVRYSDSFSYPKTVYRNSFNFRSSISGSNHTPVRGDSLETVDVSISDGNFSAYEMESLLKLLASGLNLETSYTGETSNNIGNGYGNRNSSDIEPNADSFCAVGEDTNAYLKSKFHKKNHDWHLCCEAQASSVYR